MVGKTGSRWDYRRETLLSLIIYEILVPCGPTPFKGEPGNEHFSHLDMFSLLCLLF